MISNASKAARRLPRPRASLANARPETSSVAMSLRRLFASSLLALFPSLAFALEPLPYNNPGLVVDLGVGLWAWPLPMDFDGDGDLDLVVVRPAKPSNGTYFSEHV